MAAAEMFAQALEQAPDWPPAWFALAEARQESGDVGAAAARLAQLGLAEPFTALPEAYVAHLFDDYAPSFDKHLTKNLAYRGPALIIEALDIAAPGRRFASALDIGCGAGLMGEPTRRPTGWSRPFAPNDRPGARARPL